MGAVQATGGGPHPAGILVTDANSLGAQSLALPPAVQAHPRPKAALCLKPPCVQYQLGCSTGHCPCTDSCIEHAPYVLINRGLQVNRPHTHSDTHTWDLSYADSRVARALESGALFRTPVLLAEEPLVQVLTWRLSSCIRVHNTPQRCGHLHAQLGILQECRFSLHALKHIVADCTGAQSGPSSTERG